MQPRDTQRSGLDIPVLLARDGTTENPQEDLKRVPLVLHEQPAISH